MIKHLIKVIKLFLNKFFPTILMRIKTKIDPLYYSRNHFDYDMENYFLAYKLDLEIKKKNKPFKNNLGKLLKKNNVRIHLIENQWWYDFINILSLSKGLDFQNKNKSLINRIESSNFNNLHYFEILQIYGLALRFGLFELAYHLRKKSLQIALSYKINPKKICVWKLKAKLSALLEQEDFVEFDNLFLMFDSKFKNEKLMLNHLKLILKKKERLESKSDTILGDKISNNDKNFHKYIKDKKVIIVGPMPKDNEDGTEIDRGDIVIRPNCKSKKSTGNPIQKGTKCDITYINGEQASYIKETGCPDWPSDILWIVGKSEGDAEDVLNRLKSDNINDTNLMIRNIEKVDIALFNGTLNFLPHIITDLCRFNPKKIFLYHFDLNLTKERIKGYYPKSVYPESENLIKFNLKNFSFTHDPVTQFKILKSFWKRGLISGDSSFEEVMKMDEINYMRSLEKNFVFINS